MILKKKINNGLTNQSKVKEFGLYVASNKSNSHLIFDEEVSTPCGLSRNEDDNMHPFSEVRWTMPAGEFKKWIEINRWMPDDGYRMCKRCLAAYDKLVGIQTT